MKITALKKLQKIQSNHRPPSSSNLSQSDSSYKALSVFIQFNVKCLTKHHPSSKLKSDRIRWINTLSTGHISRMWCVNRLIVSLSLKSHAAVLQQRFEVFIASGQRGVGVGSGQARAALTGLAGRRRWCRVIRYEQSDQKRHHHRAGADDKWWTGDCHFLCTKTKDTIKTKPTRRSVLIISKNRSVNGHNKTDVTARN